MVHYPTNQLGLIIICSIVLNVGQLERKVEATRRTEYDRPMNELIPVATHPLTAPFLLKKDIYNCISEFT